MWCCRTLEKGCPSEPALLTELLGKEIVINDSISFTKFDL